jgi:hypothetical protein
MCEAGGVKQVEMKLGWNCWGSESISAGIEIGILCRWEVWTYGMVSVRVCRFLNFKLQRDLSLWHHGPHLRV